MTKTVASSILAVALVAGCNDESVRTSGGVPAPDDDDIEASSDERLAFIPENDVELIDGLIPHHRMAIEMADMVIARGARPEVKEFATRMKTAQEKEIADLQRIRTELTGDSEPPELQDPHGDADMAEMSSTAGAALDTLFLEHMMAHHAGALEMAHRGLRNLQREDLRAMAKMTIDAQSMEIAEIRVLLGMPLPSS